MTTKSVQTRPPPLLPSVKEIMNWVTQAPKVSAIYVM